ncbi:hypothetical protein N431DRAFT_427686 [Stipitochalara longipes BDJ]|nr:hypothetical protein N431DRAFT_427686 [Stipitochalara longipes BDJ]
MAHWGQRLVYFDFIIERKPLTRALEHPHSSRDCDRKLALGINHAKKQPKRIHQRGHSFYCSWGPGRINYLLYESRCTNERRNMSTSLPIAFPTFNQLPPELRRQIWRESAPVHRLVPIKYLRATYSYVSRIRPPVLLQVNRESRREGLAIYHELRLGPIPIQDCYVDLTRDIVYLKSDLHDRDNREDALDASETNMGHRGRLASPPLQQHALPMPPLTRPSPTVSVPEEGDQPPLRHSKIILHDLLTSIDGETMLQALHVNSSTWSAICRHYRYRRHHLTFHLKHLVLVYEYGNGPLSDSIHLSPIKWAQLGPDEERPPTHREDRVATIMKQSFRAEAMSINHKDRLNGRPSVLNFTVEAKRLDRIGGDGRDGQVYPS